MTNTSQSVAIVAHQLPLCLPLPRICGPVEFRDFCALWERMDAILCAGIEREFVLKSIAHHHTTRTRSMTVSEQASFQLESQHALRCTVARLWLQESLRKFSCHLAESAVLRRFCRLGDLDEAKIPGRSQLKRYADWLPEPELRAIIGSLTLQAESPEAPTTLGLQAPVDCSTVWIDSTCMETPIHFPVDWVLFRDAVRTIILAILVLRAHGLKCRMPDPTTFMTAINRLCIKMTHTGKGETAKQKRKAVLREMKAVLKTVQGHAERYVAEVNALESPRGWAIAARRRLEGVLAQLPAVIHQAHERIIGERPVATADKLLSLYEPDTAVIVRGKAGAQVEFGHSLLVVEQRDGLIVDWALPQTPRSDVSLVPDSIARWQETYGPDMIRTVVADRGFDGKATRAALEAAGIANGLCPRNPHHLEEQLQDGTFRAWQRRRAQTEGRIAIVKQTFFGGRFRTKGYAHHAVEMASVILTHNLWVLARLPIAIEQKQAA